MERIRTLKSKILLLVLIVLLTATVFFIAVSKWEFEGALYHREQEAAKNDLHLVLQAIENQYQDLVYHNRTVLEMRKEAMKDVSRAVISTIDGFYERFSKGLLSEQEAKQLALERVRAIRYGKNDYFFVYDADYTAISHPDPVFMGKKLKDYRDAKGLLVVQELMKASRQEGGGFVPYQWKRLRNEEPATKLGYAIFYPRWQWMIGTGLYIDDLDAEYQKKLNAIAAQLKSSFSKIKAQNGASLFLFNGKRELLVPPVDSGDQIPNLEEFMEASRRPNQPFRYRLQSAGTSPKEVWNQAYVVYFAPFDWYVVGAFDEAKLEKPGKILMHKAMVFTAVALIIGLALAYLIAAKVSRPLSRLAGYAKNLPSQEFRSAPDPAVEGLSRRADEIGRLAQAFLFMHKMLQEYLDHLKKTTAAKERIESELKIAHDIQMSLVPKIFPPFPDREEFDLYATLVPAREVGGDFYDFFFLDKDRLCLAIGDVSGKGVPASLFMAVTKTLFKATSAGNDHPDQILGRLNDELCKDNTTCMFVTFFGAILDIQTGQMEYSNAGHNLPYKLSHEQAKQLETTEGTVVGAFEGANFEKNTIALEPGDWIIFYTDGVTEAMNAQKELFSECRLEQFLASLDSNISAEELTRRLASEVREFSAGTEQSDDMTILVLRYWGNGNHAQSKVTLDLRNDLSELTKLNHTLTGFVRGHSLPEAVLFDMKLALEEIITNAICHNFTDDLEHRITVSIALQQQVLSAEVEDDGPAFNPLEITPPDTTLPLEERPVGGLGIHLVRTLMDEVAYRRQNGTNVLVLKKEIRECNRSAVLEDMQGLNRKHRESS